MANMSPRPMALCFAALRALQSLLVVVSFVITASGCLRAITDKSLDVAAAAKNSEGETTEPAKTHDTAAEAISPEEVAETLTTKITRPDPVTKLPTTEVADGWYRDLAHEDKWSCPPGEFRWRHDGLATLLKSSGPHAAALKAACKSEDKFVRAAATIGLARLEPAKSAKPLGALVRDTNLPTNVRRAAVETLGNCTVAETEAELRALEERFGATDRGMYQEPLLYAEVLAALARHVAVDQDPIFVLALSAPDTEVQLAALSLWSAAKGLQLPAEAEALAKHPHARIRRAALSALVAGEHPSAIDQLSAATQDADLQVRVAAIELLGRMRTHEAVILLNAQSQHDQERHREAAAAALVEQQEWSAVERIAQDTSFRVRVALAVALAKQGGREHTALAQRLLKDSSAMVQAKMCESLATWPPEVAVPLLLVGLDSNNMLTRQEACQALNAHKVDLAGFNPGAAPPERRAKLAALTDEWRQAHPAVATQESTTTGSQLSLDEVARLIKEFQSPGNREAQWIARKQLERLGQPIMPVLDQLTIEHRVTIEEATYRDLLATISPDLQAIEELRSADATQRRAAARRLAQQARQAPLSRLALERLSSVARTESDSLVWSDILRASGYTTTIAAHELALAALTHSESDVRRRACEYLAICGDKRQADAVARLIDDRDPVVAKAALTALVRCGLPTSRAGLHALLASHDAHMQVAAAQALAKWQDDRGIAALERMALSGSPATQRIAIGAMAELEDARFVDVLVKALDEEASVRLAALNALPKAAGEDALKTASAAVSAGDKARAWQTWYAKQR